MCRKGQVFIGDVVERFPDALRHGRVGQVLAFSGASSVTIGGRHGCRPNGSRRLKILLEDFEPSRPVSPISTKI
jgi:hypothetical protein